jgi:hypothetical protein
MLRCCVSAWIVSKLSQNLSQFRRKSATRRTPTRPLRTGIWRQFKPCEHMAFIVHPKVPIGQLVEAIWQSCETCARKASIVHPKLLIGQLRRTMVQDLRAHGIHCTSWGAVGAAAGVHLHVVRDLEAHGIVGWRKKSD